jgi:hypothetical protein
MGNDEEMDQGSHKERQPLAQRSSPKAPLSLCLTAWPLAVRGGRPIVA